MSLYHYFWQDKSLLLQRQSSTQSTALSQLYSLYDVDDREDGKTKGKKKLCKDIQVIWANNPGKSAWSEKCVFNFFPLIPSLPTLLSLPLLLYPLNWPTPHLPSSPSPVPHSPDHVPTRLVTNSQPTLISTLLPLKIQRQMLYSPSLEP